MVTVFLLTIFVDLIMAVGVGITFASIVAVYKVSKKTRMQTSNIDKKYNLDDKGIEILQIDGSLFFGTASILDKKIDKIKPETKFVILNCLKVRIFDISAIFMVEEIIKKLSNDGIDVILLLKHSQKRKIFKVDSDKVFYNTKIYSCVDEAISNIEK